MIFIPYKQIGKYKFGQKISEFSIKENVSYKYFINKDEYMLRFDNGVFTQLYVDLALFKEQILLEDKNLNDAKELGLIVKNKVTIERKAHWVIPELGLVVSKKFDELYFFDNTLLDKWSLIHRPITSW